MFLVSAPHALLVGRSAAPRAHSAAQMSLADTTTGWYQAQVDKLADGLALQPKEDTAELGFDSFSVGGCTGKAVGFEAPGAASNVAWCSGLTMAGDDYARSSLTVWVGPLSDVPHLAVSCGVSDGGVDLSIDFRPRSAAGYDGRDPEPYPDPETREAFTESGERKDYAGAYYTEDAFAWRAALMELGENTPLSAEEMARTSAGPLYLDLKLPATEEAAAAAAAACEAAIERWTGWMAGSTDNGRDLPAGARQTKVYDRDTKVRQAAYGGLLAKYTARFGDDGKGLAAADAGPMDEAYVGGAS